MKSRLSRAAGCVAIVSLAACSSPAPGGGQCLPGVMASCECPGGGARVCGPDGTFGACECGLVGGIPDPTGQADFLLDFGPVAAGGHAPAALPFRNLGAEPIELRASPLSAPFQEPLEPLRLPPGREGTLAWKFWPVAAGTSSAVGRIAASGRELTVRLVGEGFEPALDCESTLLDFGVVSRTFESRREVRCVNAVAHPWSLSAPEVTGADATSFRSGRIPTLTVDPGETVHFEVFAKATRTGPLAAALEFRSHYRRPIGSIELRAEGAVHEPPPCEVRLVPRNLWFGRVEPGRAATLEFALRNEHGDAECEVRNLRLDPGCDPAYSLPGGERARLALPPGGEARIPVQFLPTREAHSFTCEVGFDSPGDLHQVVSVSGASLASCVSVFPGELELGTQRLGCAGAEHRAEIRNDCTAPIQIGSVQVGAGPSAEFELGLVPPPGTVLRPGDAATAAVFYRPSLAGSDVGSLLIGIEGEPAPHLVVLHASAEDGTRTDAFEQVDRPKADVLWVIDNVHTMRFEQQALADHASAFLAFARERQLDFQLAVTTGGLSPGGNCPGGARGDEDGRLFPVDGSRPRILTPATPDLDAAWQGLLGVGTCHETGGNLLEAAWLALHPPLSDHCDDPRHAEPADGNCGFLRPEAHLSIVAVADWTQSAPQGTSWYRDAFLALKDEDPDRFGFHAITGDRETGCVSAAGQVAGPGDQLIALAESTDGGFFRSICTDDWDALLRDLAPAAFGQRLCFALGGRPDDVNGDRRIDDADLEVRLDGVPALPRDEEGRAVWRYREDRRAVCFEPANPPGPGTQLEIEYRSACPGP